MIPLLENIFESFPEEIGATATSPDMGNLFKIRDESDPVHIHQEHDLAFQHSMVQLLYIVPIYRRDIQTTVSLKKTRVRKLDEDDLIKLNNI